MKSETASGKKILKSAMKNRSMLQIDVAKALGIGKSSITSALSRSHIGLDMFTRLLNVLDYDVTVTDRETGEAIWTVKELEEE